MNGKTIYAGAVVSLLLLFTACDMTGLGTGRIPDSGGKAAVRVIIENAGIQGRTIMPVAALEGTAWELWGGKSGDTETLQEEFSGQENTTVYLETGIWSFTLKGYKDGLLILTGNITDQIISLDYENILDFTAAPVLDGNGTIAITIELPDGSGITEARIFQDGTEYFSVVPVDNRIVLEAAYVAGDHFFSVRLYKDAELYGVVSEVVQVRANLESAKTYTLTWEDLNRLYVITYHLWDGETETGYYRSTDAAVTLAVPSQSIGTDYVFGGWYDNEDLSGSAVATIPTGSTGDRDFYAKWTEFVDTPSNLSLTQALTWIKNNAEEGGAYTITLKDEEFIEPQTLSYTVGDVHIAINGGEGVERTVGLFTTSGSLFIVESGVTLTLGNNVTLQGVNDNSAELVRVNSGGALVMESGSKITSNRNKASYSGGGVRVDGIFTMYGGEISGNSASYYYGGGVYVSSNGTFTMSGGTISGNSSYGYGGGGVYVTGTFTMSGGEISGNSTAYNGAGVFVWESATFTMSGGMISGNTASGGYGHGSGGGVYVKNFGTFTQSGGEISDNSTVSNGGGVFIESYSTFIQSGGAISGNSTVSNGGGVYVERYSTFTQSGGAISGNSTSGYGGGVYVYNSSTFIQSDGTISGNTASSGNGGGVYVDSSTFTQSGGTISDNSANRGGGVYVYSGTFTKQAGGIIYGSNAEGGLKNTATEGYTYGHAVYIASSPTKLRNVTAGNGGTLDSAVSGSAGGWETSISSNLTLTQALTWINNNAAEGGAYIITLNADEAITPKSLSYGVSNVSIALIGDSAERTVSLSTTGSLFTIGSGVTLTLGNNVTLQGVNDNTESLVQVNSGGTLVMASGSKITGNTSSGSSSAPGGGVLVNYGTFMMSGGEISGNSAGANANGGGVYVSSGAFTMSGGTISSNSAYSGGGVYNSAGAFTQSGGAITVNTSISGGGVTVTSHGTFTQSGGTISDNTTVHYGGGVYANNGTFTQSGGTISGNTATSSSGYGGGVAVGSNGGTFTKQAGGIIYGSDAEVGLKNTANHGDDYGHAVYVASGSKIRHSTADSGITLDSAVSGSAGGWEAVMPSGSSLAELLAWIADNAEEGGEYTVTINADESIAPTTLSYSGKNVSINLDGGTTERTVSLSSSGSLFTIGSGVTLTLRNNVTLQGRSDNTSSLVRVNGGALVMDSGSKISGNYNSSYNGGGVYVDNSGTFTQSGGEISGNTASYGGGVYVDSSGTFTMNGGEISGNIASYGGGVYVLSSGTFTKQSGGTIYGSDTGSALSNTATNGDDYGHAVYVSNGGKKRNTTAGSGVTLDSGINGSAGGWEPSTQTVQISLRPTSDDPSLSNTSFSVDEEAWFSAGSGYTSWTWYWNGEVVGDASTYTLAAYSQTPGIYELSVVVTTSMGETLSTRCRVIVNAN